MSKEKRRVPKLRFPGFTEDWEQRKLGNLTQLITKGTTPKVKNIQNGINFIKVENISDDGVISINSYVSEEEHMNYLSRSILANNDILFSIAGTLGRTAIVKSHLLPANTNQALAIIRLNKSVDVEYINTFLKSNAIKTYIRKNPTVGAQPNLSLGQVSDLEINIPNYSEQKKISNLFSKFDLMITLHQRKLDNLKLKKKALLQKLFPKNGERYPELRFPGFTDAWEQRKLSDVLVERNEQQVETREYPLMSFVQGLGVTPKGERYDRSFLVLDQSKKYKRTELGDFIYSSNNLETGSIGINKTGKAVISPVYSIFQGVSIGDSQFIGIMSLLPRFIAKMIRFRQGVVYGQWRIHETDFLDISVLIPSVDERTKITQLILSIEELITLHQRKLEHLQLQKKALLQQLFI